MSRFIICRASAGSGKTYTLVRQFIEIAISSGYDDQLAQRFSQILAITFTNKAANGMKERIMARLGEIVHNNPKAQALINEMASHLNVSADEVRRRSSVLQSAILHNYSDFSVCTIDSFVHRLVRTFAHDLNLPMNFNVQIDQQEIIQSIVDEMLSLAGNAEEQALTQLLCAFSQSQMDDGKGYKVERSIAKLSKEIFKEEAPQFLPQLEQIKLPQFITIHDRLLADIRDYEKKISSAAAAFLQACADNGLEADDFPNKGTVYNFFQAIEQGDFDKINKTHKRVDDAYKEQKLHIKSTPQSLLPAFQAVL
ncbi:MAG: UvrD-helicase domain-containing protein, partial [Bacteroidales bacterium]|nr:UvrD-helicase domain-containing protein [Bacteroidales bacterium]